MKQYQKLIKIYSKSCFLNAIFMDLSLGNSTPLTPGPYQSLTVPNIQSHKSVWKCFLEYWTLLLYRHLLNALVAINTTSGVPLIKSPKVAIVQK